jgi:DNA-binding HxlR family transcriptional regulator
MPVPAAETADAAENGSYLGPDGLYEALAVVGDRWSLAIVRALLDGPLRFGAMQQLVPEISPNVLSQRLRALQAAGLLVAVPYSRRPARYLYELTTAGGELAAPLRLLEGWGSRRAGAGAGAARHSACETPLQMRWYCPTCEEPVREGESATSPEPELYFA